MKTNFLFAVAIAAVSVLPALTQVAARMAALPERDAAIRYR